MEIKYSQTTFKELRTNIELGEIKIPPFQRTFDWSGKDMARFFNSIVMGEPFGSIMLWKDTKNKSDIRQTNIHFNALAKNAPVTNTNRNYLVDGQQRTTSFLLLYLLNNRDKYDAKQLTKAENIYFSLKDMKFYFSKSEKNLYIPASWFFAEEFKDIRNKVSEKYDLRDANVIDRDRDEILEELQNVHQKFQDIKIGETIVQTDSLDDVINVFTLINTKGKRLSPFNIVHAYFVAKDIDLDSAFDSIIKKLPRKWSFNKSELLILAYSALENTISNSTILEKTNKEGGIGDREKNFFKDTFLKLLQRLVSTLEHLHFKTLDFLPSMNIANILISLLYNDFHEPLTANQYKIIKEWLKLAIINERYVSGSEGIKQPGYKQDRDSLKEAIDKNTSIRNVLPENKNWIKEMEFDSETIKYENYGSNSATYKYLISKILQYIPSFVSGNTINVDDIDKLKDLNFHHIFPKGNSTYENEEYINSVANITPLEKESNIKISNKRPHIYFTEYLQENKITKDNLSKILLDYNSLDDYESFLNDRSLKIAKLINTQDNFEKEEI